MPVLRLFVAAALAATAVVACSSSSSPSTGLAAALDVVPRDATSVLFTDWAAFHKGAPNGPTFAGGLVDYDALLATDLGFRSADALWEADVTRPNAGPATVLRFPDKTDLAAVESRLARFGYTKTSAGGHDVLTGRGLSASASIEHGWQIPMQAVAIDANRHLLVAGGAAGTVNGIFSGGKSLASRPDVQAVAKQVSNAVSAFVAVDKQACLPITALLGGHSTPQLTARIRQQIAPLGTFTPFTAEAVAVLSTSGDTGKAALAFPDASAAKANAKGRAAAPAVVNHLEQGQSNAIRVTGTSVSGAVLTLTLQSSSPRVLPQAVQTRALGLDLCL